MRVVTPKHLADHVQAWTLTEGAQKKGVSRQTALAVLDALWECNKRNQMHVYPRIEVIAESAGIRSRTTVGRALTALVEQGLIIPLGPRHGGRNQPTVWGLVDNPGNRPLSGRFREEKPTTQWQKPTTQWRETNHSVAETNHSVVAQGREKEERKEERMKRQPPLRLVDPPEPPRACRMPGCDRPALVGSRCLRHASGLPFPIPQPADGVPVRPERREETA